MESTIQDQQLREHPAATRKRLEASGHWTDAEQLLRKVKMKLHRRYRKAGGALTPERRMELAKVGWDAVHDQWGPPAGTKPMESLRAYVEGTRSASEEHKREMPTLSAEAEKRFSELGELTDPTSAVVYAFENIETPHVEPLLCPSRGAWALLGRARFDPEWFYSKIYRPTISAIAKQKAEQQSENSEPSKPEKRAIEDMTRMLTQLKEQVERVVCPECGAVVRGPGA